MKRIILIVVGVIVALGILGFITVKIFPQLVIVPTMKIKYSEKKWPALYVTPIDRGIISNPEKQDGGLYDKYGVAFRMPYKSIKQEERHNIVLVTLLDKKTVAVMNTDFDPFLGREEFLDAGNGKGGQMFEAVYGADAVRSAYEFRETIFNETPANMHISMSARDAIERSTIIIYKSVATFTNKDGSPKKIFKFSNADVQGFQYGDPRSSETTTVQIDFIKKGDSKGRELLISGMTQEEIDTILATLTVK